MPHQVMYQHRDPADAQGLPRKEYDLFRLKMVYEQRAGNNVERRIWKWQSQRIGGHSSRRVFRWKMGRDTIQQRYVELREPSLQRSWDEAISRSDFEHG